MSKELKELRDTLADYALDYCINDIPQQYFEKIEKTWQDMKKKGHDWDKSKAAATLLHSAVLDGIVHQSQMTPQGYKALSWAENFHKKLKAIPT